MIIGLIGGSGSGKSIVCSAAHDLGLLVIDADKVGHNIILKGEKAYFDIIDFFGNDILLENSEIDRKALGRIVFNDSLKLQKLNEITHKRITEEILKQLQGHRGNALIDAAILPQTELIKKCNCVICVFAPMEKRIENICLRDNISREMAVSRIKSQMTDDEYKKFANYQLNNDKNIYSLYESAYSLIMEVVA